MAEQDRSPNERGAESQEGSFLREDLPRMLVMSLTLVAGVLLGFGVYLWSQDLSWTPIAVMVAIAAVAAYVALRWKRKIGAGEPIFQGRQLPAEQEVPTTAAEKQAERDASLALEEKIIYLRFLDEFQEALHDLDQTGECQLPKSLLRREKVEVEQVSGILALWISEDFGLMVDIRSKEISRGKVRFFDPKWSETGPYSAPSDAGNTDEDDE